MKSSKGLKKGDIIIIASIALISALWFIISFLTLGEKQQVRIYLEGEIYRTADLSAVEGEELITIDGCEIKITKDGACFLTSDCPDGLCVKRGMLTKSGDVMACVPKGITVEITGGKAVDGISY
ncbi:MAG: NusG domain II-containing protein [Clostridia bacterium]|nr:NusG domain II-containing protein [Clostridia bacterium]